MPSIFWFAHEAERYRDECLTPVERDASEIKRIRYQINIRNADG